MAAQGTTGFRLDELARRVGGVVHGDPGRVVRGIATLEQAGPDDLSFLTHPRYREAALRTRAAALLVPAAGAIAGKDLLQAPDAYLALALLIELFHPSQREPPGVSPDARVAGDARLGEEVHVGPFAVIGA